MGATGVDYDSTRLDSGLIYLFRWDNSAGTNGQGDWVMHRSGLTINPISNDGFGRALSLNFDGTSLVAAAESGVFVYSGTTYGWKRDRNLDSLLSADQLARFGTSIILYSDSISISKDGGTIAVGKIGVVFVFTNVLNWNLKSIMIPNPEMETSIGRITSSRFGENVSLSGDGNVLVVSDYSVDRNFSGNVHTDVGMIYVYRLAVSGGWKIWSEYLPSLDGNSYFSDMQFGKCINLSNDGNLIVTGLPGSTDFSPEGEASSLAWNGNTISNKNMMGDWTNMRSLYPNAAEVNDIGVLKYGCNSKLSGDGNTLLVEGQRVVKDPTSFITDLYIY